MPEFKYKAMDKKGNVYVNTLQAKTRIDCINILKRNKLQPLDITETKNGMKFEGILKANDDIKNVTESKKLKNILNETLISIEAGEYMYETMEKYPKVFPFIVTNIIKVGELSRDNGRSC